MPRPRASIPLNAPRVHFAPDYLERLGRLIVRVASARERREGAGRARMLGPGTEFVGFRPYRPGEDLRLVDQALLARSRRPFVRLARREASERWAILLDTSASMGIGTPGKLQAAAEVATAIAAVGRKEGATVELLLSGTRESYVMQRGAQLAGWMRVLERVSAEGRDGLGALLAEPGRFRSAGAVFLVGDLLDLEPREALSGGALTRRGRDLFCVQLLADEELAPPVMGRVRWVDAETGRLRITDVDAQAVAAYERLLGRELEAWGAACSRHRAFYGTWRTSVPFEHVATSLFAE